MEIQLETVIKQKISLLVDFILEKAPNADKDLINHQINKLMTPTLNGVIVSKNKKSIKKKSLKILNTIEDQKSVIMVKKSQFSNYILTVDKNDHKYQDLKTNKFIMDIDTKTIIGIENLKGEIEPLNKNLIEICHKYKLKYDIPLNLNENLELDQDTVIANELQELGLNYVESEESDEENND